MNIKVVIVILCCILLASCAGVSATGGPIKKIYEYSYETPNGGLIYQQETNNATIQYISLGLPDIETRTNNGLAAFKEDNGELYMVNGYNVYI